MNNYIYLLLLQRRIYFIYISPILCFSGKIYIHCLAGRSRSATIVIAYFMIKQQLSLREAAVNLRQKRNVYPNSGFLQELCDLNNTLYSTKPT